MNNIKNIFTNKIYLLLIIAVLFSALIRFYKLADVPVSLYWDEVSQGYNAYSISQSLRDEFGVFMPLLFRAFDDYKMPLNIYLTAASIKAMGLSDFAVRFPSALLGTFTVFIAYFLVAQIFKRSGWQTGEKCGRQIALLCSLFLAISPWHIQFSRGGFEANIALFFIVLGSYLFLKGLEEYKFYICSLISFVAASYSYRSIEIFLPILLLGFLIVWRKELMRYGIIKIGLGLFLLGILITPILISLLREGSARFNQTSISTEVNKLSLSNFKKGVNINRKIIYTEVFFQNYLSQFSPQFLFISGDPNGRHSPRGMGMLYLWEAPFLLIGLYILLKRFSFPAKSSVLIWLLASPLPAALSTPAPHALRALNILPMPQILTAIGVVAIYFILKRNMRNFYLGIISIFILFFCIRYGNLYNYTNTRSNVADWGDGYRQLTEYIFAKESSYDRILISGHYWEPYVYFLFYKKYDQKIYQKSGTSNGFAKYIFGGTSWDKDKNSQELGNINLRSLAATSGPLLVALSPDEYHLQEKNINVSENIKNNNGNIVFIVGKLK
jgi:4-amino-4-deoxy-L-arabinose transferase-like glycosyltransferase